MSLTGQDYFWAMSEILDQAKEVGAGSRTQLMISLTVVEHYDPRLVALPRTSGLSLIGDTSRGEAESPASPAGSTISRMAT